MSEQQIISQDEKKRKKLIKHQKISKVLFIIFIISFCTMLSSWYYFSILPLYSIGIFALIFMWLLFPAYLFYLIVSTIFSFRTYKIVLKFNAIAISILVIFATISNSGFCYKEKRFLDKSEIIDGGLKYVIKSCKKSEENDIQCPTTLAELKETYPQCFGQNLSDKCIVKIEYLNTYSNKTLKTDFTVYQLEPWSYKKLTRLLLLPFIQTWGQFHYRFSTSIFFSHTSNGLIADACGI